MRLDQRLRVEPALAGLVLTVGIVLRLFHLSDIPFGLNNDAAYSGIVAINATHTSSYIPWSPDPQAGETLFDYLIAAMFPLFGPSSLAMRVATAACGILGIGSAYVFTRRLLGSTTALIATFLLATSGWHLVFSRAGWRLITLPLVEMLALYFLLRAIETRRRGSFALAGALLGLVLNTYLAGRVVPALAALLMVIELARGPARLQLVRGYASTVIAFLFASASVLAFAVTNPSAFNARYESVSSLSAIFSGNWGLLWQHISRTAGIFTVRANGNDFFLDQPLLDQPARWLFLLGLAVAVVMVLRRSRPHVYLLLGLIVTLLPAFVAEWPNGNRSSGTMPFVYIVTALPLVAMLKLGRQYLQPATRLARTVPTIAVTAILVISLVGTFNQYLGPSRSYIFGFAPDATQVGSYIRQIDHRYVVSIMGPNPFGASTISYLTYEHGDPPIALNPDGTPSFSQRHFEITNELTVSNAHAGPHKGLAFIWNGDGETYAAQAKLRFARARVFTLMYRDGPVFSPAAIVLLVPPRGRSVTPRDLPPANLVQP